MTAARLITIGVGGATSSGKTTLAKHLADLLVDAVREHNRRPSSTPGDARDVLILHQDDFAPKEEELPWNQEFQLRDWDTPHGSIDYKRMDGVLSHLRQTGALPDSHSSHDHLNILPQVPLPESFRSEWKGRFRNALVSAQKGPSSSTRTPLQLALVDGFLLYFSPLVRRHLDIKFLLRTKRATIQRRREARASYATAEGTTWVDPPGYFDKIVWPAYVEAHKNLFEGGDVEKGELVGEMRPQGDAKSSDTDDGLEGGRFDGLTIIDGEGSAEGSEQMMQMVRQACEVVEGVLQQID